MFPNLSYFPKWLHIHYFPVTPAERPHLDLGLDFFSSLLSDDVVRRKPTLIDGSSAFYPRRNELHSPIDRDRAAVYPLFKAEADSMEEVGGRASHRLEKCIPGLRSLGDLYFGCL